MLKPKFTGKKIKPAWTKHAKKAIPSQANILSVGRKRKNNTRLIKFTTKTGRVIRHALLDPITHKAAKIPAEVLATIEKKVPKSATALEVTKRGKKFRIIYNVKGKTFQVFVWQKKEKVFKVYKTQKLDVTRITRAGPKVRSRTVKKTVIE